MTAKPIHLHGRHQIGLRVGLYMAALAAFVLAWISAARDPIPLWNAIPLALIAVALATIASLLTDTQATVTPEGVHVRRSSAFRTKDFSVPAAEIKGIGTRPELLAYFYASRWMIIPPTWHIAIDTTNHGRIRAGQGVDEKQVVAKELEVRRILGW